MKIERTTVTTKFHTPDKLQIKKLLCELGVVKVPNCTPQTNFYEKIYVIRRRLTTKQIEYIEDNFIEETEMGSSRMIVGFKGNLITAFNWIYG